MTRLLSDLVAIPSVNPMGRPFGGPGFLEAGMSDYLEAWFRDLGVPCERITVSPGRDNLLARYDAPDSRRTILFDAHQDTVPTDGMTIPAWTPDVVGGRLYGRGSCDIKGGMAAMLLAFARLVRERPAGSASVVMACTVDEEYTHTGSDHLALWPHGADFAIVAEPTGLEIVDRHKGAVRWKIRADGVACHSSTPHLGDNAIYRMATVVSSLARHACELAGMPPVPMLGTPSLSVGRIEGGVSANVVPDRCEIDIDRRLLPGETPDAAVDRVRAALGDLRGLTFLPPWVKMPALGPRADDPWLAPIREAMAGALGREPGVIGVPYGTDAGPLNQAGLPCYVVGPGDIAQAHTKDEWIELDQVRAAVDVYYGIARHLG
ncbi:M20 family metallopeptidase [Tundrisphaera sp. TA3]|uniref:M20 family metallopeptidase n=1 Tax=Tundrisphaera sp. TA3 TaxID=3435775 RepID=UPI003EC0A7D2